MTRALLRDTQTWRDLHLLRVMELLPGGSNRLWCVCSPGFLPGFEFHGAVFRSARSTPVPGSSSVLGNERSREEAQALQTVAVFLGQLNDRWRNFDHYESACPLGPRVNFHRGIIRPSSIWVSSSSSGRFG